MCCSVAVVCICCFFFFQAEDGIRDVAVTGVQTCALPISFFGGTYFPKAARFGLPGFAELCERIAAIWRDKQPDIDRKSTRLNSSHGYISYAVFCLKKKNNQSVHMTTGLITHLQHLCSTGS